MKPQLKSFSRSTVVSSLPITASFCLKLCLSTQHRMLYFLHHICSFSEGADTEQSQIGRFSQKGRYHFILVKTINHLAVTQTRVSNHHKLQIHIVHNVHLGKLRLILGCIPLFTNHYGKAETQSVFTFQRFHQKEKLYFKIIFLFKGV